MRQQGNAMPPRLADAISSKMSLLMYQNLRTDLRVDYPIETHIQTTLTDDYGFELAGD